MKVISAAHSLAPVARPATGKGAVCSSEPLDSVNLTIHRGRHRSRAIKTMALACTATGILSSQFEGVTGFGLATVAGALATGLAVSLADRSEALPLALTGAAYGGLSAAAAQLVTGGLGNSLSPWLVGGATGMVLGAMGLGTLAARPVVNEWATPEGPVRHETGFDSLTSWDRWDTPEGRYRYEHYVDLHTTRRIWETPKTRIENKHYGDLHTSTSLNKVEKKTPRRKP